MVCKVKFSGRQVLLVGVVVGLLLVSGGSNLIAHPDAPNDIGCIGEIVHATGVHHCGSFRILATSPSEEGRGSALHVIGVRREGSGLDTDGIAVEGQFPYVQFIDRHGKLGGQLISDPENGRMGFDYVAPGDFFIRSAINDESKTVLRIDKDGNVSIKGNLTAASKSFVQDDPADPTKQIVYVSLEGPEAGTYIRGTAQLVNGEAVIDLPEHFSLVTNDEGLTVQLTPRGEWLQLYLVKTSTKQIIVREASGKSGQFDYLVQGIRKGFENHQVVQEKEVK